MDKISFSEELERKAKQLDVPLEKKQLDQFFQYKEMILDWNQKINLTAIKEEKEMIDKHFIDSISIVSKIEGKETILDVGTGAGFPGIPIKIAKEEVEITLLDSLRKRIVFLEEVIKQLQLKKIETIHGRAEEIGQDISYREKYDVVLSRAVATSNVLLEYMLPFVKIGGKCICMKGPNLQEEIKDIGNALLILGGEVEEIQEIVLPETEMKRTIMVIKKVQKTPMKYPRKAGIPSKQPL